MIDNRFCRRAVSGRASAQFAYALDRIEAGVEAALKDPALAASTAPDLSDRPRSRGEQVEAAIERFKTERTRAAMDYLLDALHFTPTAAQGRIVEKAYRRKGQPTLAAELHRLWSQTWSLHGCPQPVSRNSVAANSSAIHCKLWCLRTTAKTVHRRMAQKGLYRLSLCDHHI